MLQALLILSRYRSANSAPLVKILVNNMIKVPANVRPVICDNQRLFTSLVACRPQHLASTAGQSSPWNQWVQHRPTRQVSPVHPHLPSLGPSVRTRSIAASPGWMGVYKQTSEEESNEPDVEPPAPLPKAHPSAKQQRELHTVNTAVAVNGVILLSKLAAWGLTSSGVLLAEALHSLADIVNQLLLRAGVQQSRRAPTRQHPYGYGREKYVYALMSAVGVFCIGAGASVVHGIQCLFDPPVLENMAYSVWVLIGSGIAELFSLKVAFNAIRLNAQEQGLSMVQFISRGNDPTTVSVLAEDAGAVAGLGIAGLSSYLTWLTGNPVWDACGSITIGVLMGGIAVGLIRNNKRFLIGQAMRPETEAEIVDHLKADPMVLCVMDPKSEAKGEGVYSFKAEIQWNGDRIMHKYLNTLGRDSLYHQIRTSACSTEVDAGTLTNAMDLAMMEIGRGVIRTVGDEIDRLEAELKGKVPGLVYVDLETDRGKVHEPLICPIVGSPTEQQ